ncbi:4162_t:CDS:2, partial [Racocetra fulgida]
GIRSVNNVKTAKLESHLSKKQISKNIGDLLTKLSQSTSDHALELQMGLINLPISDLSWQDPLASQVISDQSDLILNLDKTSLDSFMEPFDKMKVEIPHNIQYSKYVY